MIINITPIAPGDAASPNLWNSRYAAITEVVNGNIDSDNLKNGSVTREKIATGAISSDKIAVDRYVDANGWTVNDLGTTKTYSYTVAINGVSIINGARKDNLPVVQPPVGRTRDNLVFTCSWYGGYAGHAVPGIEAGAGTSIAPMLGNQYVASGLGNSLTFNGVIYVQATEKI